MKVIKRGCRRVRSGREVSYSHGERREVSGRSNQWAPPTLQWPTQSNAPGAWEEHQTNHAQQQHASPRVPLNHHINLAAHKNINQPSNRPPSNAPAAWSFSPINPVSLPSHNPIAINRATNRSSNASPGAWSAAGGPPPPPRPSPTPPAPTPCGSPSAPAGAARRARSGCTRRARSCECASFVCDAMVGSGSVCMYVCMYRRDGHAGQAQPQPQRTQIRSPTLHLHMHKYECGSKEAAAEAAEKEEKKRNEPTTRRGHANATIAIHHSPRPKEVLTAASAAGPQTLARPRGP